jgi:hypothetical protein
MLPSKCGQIASFEQLQSDLNTCVSMALPTGEQPYSKAAVLSLRWADGDLGVDKAEEKLLWVLKNVYGYAVEQYTLQGNTNTDRATTSFVAAILDFLNRHDGNNALLVVIYSGHARGNNTQCLWR